MNTFTAKKARRLALPLLLAGGLGIGAAVAAQVNLSTSSLGVGSQAVSSCSGDAAVTATVTTGAFDPAANSGAGAYAAGVNITSTAGTNTADLGACNTLSYTVELFGASGSLGTKTGTWASADTTAAGAAGKAVTFASTIDASLVKHVAVTFAG